MRCDDFERWMIELQDAEPGDSRREVVFAHLGKCQRCGETWRLLEISTGILSSSPELPLPDNYFYTRLMARVRETRNQRDVAWNTAWVFARNFMAVSSVVLLLLVGLLYFDLANGGAETPVVVDGFIQPTFTDAPLTNLVLQPDPLEKDQVFEALMTPSPRVPR